MAQTDAPIPGELKQAGSKTDHLSKDQLARRDRRSMYSCGRARGLWGWRLTGQRVRRLVHDPVHRGRDQEPQLAEGGQGRLRLVRGRTRCRRRRPLAQADDEDRDEPGRLQVQWARGAATAVPSVFGSTSTPSADLLGSGPRSFSHSLDEFARHPSKRKARRAGPFAIPATAITVARTGG